tara:strand:+ start:8212 stop:9174 length:963 start_codon:yes stop_codon:yes gene_type:complete
MPQTTDRFTSKTSEVRMTNAQKGKALLAKMKIDLFNEGNASTLAHDRRARFITPEDMGNFRESQTNKSILGRRGGAVIGKMTTPGGTFPAIPTVAMRESLRVTKRNLERFRSPEVAAKEDQLRGLFTKFTNARETAVTRLRALSPELFRSRQDIRAEQELAQQKQGLRRGFASSRTQQILDAQSSVRGGRIFEHQRDIEAGIEKDINLLHGDTIRARKRERARMLKVRDLEAVEGTSGTTPLTVKFGRGRKEVVAATGDPTILQGITPEILDAQNLESGTIGKRAAATSSNISDLSKKVNETRLATARQRLKRTRDSSAE